MAEKEVKDILIRVKQEGAEKVEKKLLGLSKAQRKIEKMKKLQMKVQAKKERSEYARTRAAYEKSSRFKKRIFKKHRNNGFNDRVVESFARQKRQEPKFKMPNTIPVNEVRRRQFKLPSFDTIKQAGLNKITPTFNKFKNGMVFATNAASSFGGVFKKMAPQLADKWADISRSVGKVSFLFRRLFGEGMMVLGAFMMIKSIMGRIGATILAVGEKFSQVEQKVMVGDAYRERLFSEGGNKLVQSFNRAVKHRADLTGESKADAAVILSKAASTLTEFGAKYSEKTLKQLSDAAFGVAAITGEEQTTVLEKILKIAQEGKGEEKLKLGQLRLTKNINDNIRRIAEGAYANPIASKVIKESSVQASMMRMKNGVHDLFANVFAQHPRQIRSAFKRMADNFTSVLSEDVEVQEAFERVLTNFTTALDETFTKDDIKRVALGAAEWSANIIDATKQLAKGVKWVINNPDKVMNALELFGKVWLGFKAFQIASATASGILDTLRLLRLVKNGLLGFVVGDGLSARAIGSTIKGIASFGLELKALATTSVGATAMIAGAVIALGYGIKKLKDMDSKNKEDKKAIEESYNNVAGKLLALQAVRDDMAKYGVINPDMVSGTIGTESKEGNELYKYLSGQQTRLLNAKSDSDRDAILKSSIQKVNSMMESVMPNSSKSNLNKESLQGAMDKINEDKTFDKLQPKADPKDALIEAILQQYEKEKEKSYFPETEDVAMSRPSNQKTIVVNGDVNLNTNGNSVNEEYIMQMA